MRGPLGRNLALQEKLRCELGGEELLKRGEFGEVGEVGEVGFDRRVGYYTTSGG
jgi:hypothetical protein